MVAPLAYTGSGLSDVGDRLIATADSGVTSLEDFPGHTIAVPALNNLAQITINALLDKHGIDPGSVNYTVVTYPEQQAAFESGAIDVAFSTEPYVTLLQQATDIEVLAAPVTAIGTDCRTSW